MFHIILYQPEIPPNTGNIIRLCANAGAGLHLIHPLGFEFDDKRLRRAGLDYHEFASVQEHHDFKDIIEQFPENRIYACSTKAEIRHSDISYQPDDVFLFGPETRGLPDDLLHHPRITEMIRIPMKADSRSLNLSNAVSIILYEAWRQMGYG